MERIEGSFYRLTPINDSSPLFDLELLYDIKGKNPRSEYKIEGYGYPLDAALERICHYAVRKNLKEEIVTLKEYIEEYGKRKAKLSSEIR